jgi:hypothetical protein
LREGSFDRESWKQSKPGARSDTSKEQGATSKEQQASSYEQEATSKEQQASSYEQEARSKELRAWVRSWARSCEELELRGAMRS